jgi:hypothetical protein
LGFLAWKVGALFARGDGEWRIDRERFVEGYGWDPWGDMIEDVEALPEHIDLVRVAWPDGEELSRLDFACFADFIEALNDELEWSFSDIAGWLKACGL